MAPYRYRVWYQSAIYLIGKIFYAPYKIIASSNSFSLLFYILVSLNYYVIILLMR